MNRVADILLTPVVYLLCLMTPVWLLEPEATTAEQRGER